MAALVLLIPVVAVTAKIDRSQNKSGYQYDQVNYLKVRHGITPFAFVSIRGEKPSAIFFLPAGSPKDFLCIIAFDGVRVNFQYRIALDLFPASKSGSRRFAH